jgi:putative oxidoreductase
MNWFGSQGTEGMEFFLLMIGLAASLVFSGAGRFSIDSLITKHKPTNKPSAIGKKNYSF